MYADPGRVHWKGPKKGRKSFIVVPHKSVSKNLNDPGGGVPWAGQELYLYPLERGRGPATGGPMLQSGEEGREGREPGMREPSYTPSGRNVYKQTNKQPGIEPLIY